MNMQNDAGTRDNASHVFDKRYYLLDYLYRYFDASGGLLYVGITNDIARRREQHCDKWWHPHVAYQSIEEYESRDVCKYAEAVAIRDERPEANANAPYPSLRRDVRDYIEKHGSADGGNKQWFCVTHDAWPARFDTCDGPDFDPSASRVTYEAWQEDMSRQVAEVKRRHEEGLDQDTSPAPIRCEVA